MEFITECKSLNDMRSFFRFFVCLSIHCTYSFHTGNDIEMSTSLYEELLWNDDELWRNEVNANCHRIRKYKNDNDNDKIIYFPLTSKYVG